MLYQLLGKSFSGISLLLYLCSKIIKSMSQETQNTPNSNDEEVDIIRLFNYFKQGINSFFRRIGKLFEYIIQFIVILKKNWMIVGGLVLIGGLYGGIINPLLIGSEVKYYEMTVRSGPVSNLELYAFASEIKNQKSTFANPQSEGIQLAKELGIISLQVDPLLRDEDVINNYFEQIESNKLRGLETDTIYFKSFKLKEHETNMANTDFTLQKIKIKAKTTNNSPKIIQEKLINYFNDLPGIKADQEVRMTNLNAYEKGIKRTIDNIDSIMSSRVIANKQDVLTSSNQMVLNAANRENVEKDMLRYYELFSKKLYSVQKDKSLYSNPVNIVTNLRSSKEENVILNPTIHFSLIGFLLSILVVLGLRFNRYLDQYARNNNIV